MTVDRLINILAGITLIEMIVTIGLGVIWADRLKRRAGQLSGLLNLLLLAVILIVQGRVLADIRPIGYVSMLCLATMLAGGLMDGGTEQGRKGIVITTAVRNVVVAFVIVTSSFPGTAALTSTTLYALFQTVVIALIALVWGRLAPSVMIPVKAKAA
jgi:hypothetical protein